MADLSALSQYEKRALEVLAAGPLRGKQVGVRLWAQRLAADSGCTSMRAHKILYALQARGFVGRGALKCWSITPEGCVALRCEADRG